MPAPTAVQSVLNPWPARTPYGNRFQSLEYALKAGETFNAGACVFETAGVVETAATDPQTVLGFAAEPAEGVVRAGYVNVYIADEHTIFGALLTNSSGVEQAPDDGNVTVDYELLLDSGRWTVNEDGTSSPTVTVIDYDRTGERNVVFFKVIAARRQIA